ncbi:MAG TPA: endonuclease III [Acholeplasmatales bacterium]|nr:MAG: endonuclease III [Tenericutes bacterium GWF2_57_13]HAQ55826.1 endonuclease III [Acholeplasmatales bacterium]
MIERAEHVYRELGRLFPEAKCELRYVRQIDLLVAVMLSAQTTDAAVNAATPALFAMYPDAAAYAAAPEGKIEETIRHLGLFRAKAKNIRAAATIIALDGGVIPNNQDYLERLPGVGRKTANVFLSEWYHVPRIAVDTHVGRVAYRLGFAPKGDDPAKTERRLMEVFPAERWSDLHHKMIFFGRYFCTARKPSCGICPFVGCCVEPRL